MCMTCLVTSVLILFTPSGSDLSLNSSGSIPLAQDAQVAITQVVGQLPASSETDRLRQSLVALKTQLAHARNDQEAKQILDRELAALSQQIAADPNASEINEALESLLIIPEGSSATKQLKTGQLKTGKTKLNSLLLHSPQPKWGWLQ